VDVVLAQLQARGRLATEIPGLERAAGARLAGLWFEDVPSTRLVVSLEGNIANRALERAAARSVDTVEVRYGAARTRAQLVEAIPDVATSMRTAIDQPLDVYVDEVNNTLVVTVYDESADTARSSEPPGALLSIAQAEGASSSIPIEIVLETSPPPSEDNRGGRMLDSCTSGFAVRNQSGQAGYTTAGHCYGTGTTGSPQGYYWWSDLSYRSASWRRSINTSSMDIGWLSVTAQPVEGLFHTSRTTARPQEGVRNVAVNDWICEWGSRSNNSGCGKVQSVTSTKGGTGNSGTFIRVVGNGMQLCNGDSGGPWYVENYAVGSHQGSSPKDTTLPHPFKPNETVECTTAPGVAAEGGATKTAWVQPIMTGLGAMEVALVRP